MSMQEQSFFLERLGKGIASLFGPNCEVTIHDLEKGYENTIIFIENGQVTGRRIGDGASEKVLQVLKDNNTPPQDEYSYMARTNSGRIIKSSTIFIKDENGKVIGLFGINYDITDLTIAERAIAQVLSVAKPPTDGKIDTITSNVTDLLDQLITEADTFVGKPVAMMTKEDKTKAIQFLNDRGAFLIKKSGDKVTRHYDISKYTLYNYMDSES